MKKNHPAFIGFLQALGVVVYVSLVSLFMNVLAMYPQISPNMFFSMSLMLLLLVFSAATTGAIVFGYPAYLFLNKQAKKGLQIFGYTLLFFVTFLIIAVSGIIVMS